MVSGTLLQYVLWHTDMSSDHLVYSKKNISFFTSTVNMIPGSGKLCHMAPWYNKPLQIYWSLLTSLQMWYSSEVPHLPSLSDCNLFIFPCISFFFQGLGAESKNLYPFLLPVIQLSTDVSQPPHVYLLEDGLELWYGYVYRT